jgi:hypothetical protein
MRNRLINPAPYARTVVITKLARKTPEKTAAPLARPLQALRIAILVASGRDLRFIRPDLPKLP